MTIDDLFVCAAYFSDFLINYCDIQIFKCVAINAQMYKLVNTEGIQKAEPAVKKYHRHLTSFIII